ncbi:MAG: beta-lactamase family protein [Clostridiales bacterium]|nr:beta-lactamase family protein [Clostridiales bacterium]
MLCDAIGYFTEEKRILSCLSVTCGTAESEYHAMRGVADRDGAPVHEGSLYDLASLTKLFTGLMVMRLREEGLLDISRPVTDYAPQFTKLDGVSVDQVLGFEIALVTPERVDTQPDREAGLRQLFAVEPRPVTGRAYSDMHAMVLKYVIEGAAGERYMDVLSRRVLRPLGMESTFAHVPESRLRDCICYDGEHRIEGERWLVREGIAPGTPHDPKAHLLMQGGDVCGHAGLFSTRGDMTRLCQGVLRLDVVSRESLRYMARNRTGRRLPDGGWTQFLGCQCYVKHPEQYYSEIPLYMSDQAIGLSGFTGHHIGIDPVTGVFTLFLGNRVMDRLTVLVPAQGRSRADYGLAEDGSGQVRWSDGRLLFSSVDYVHQKDSKLHAPIRALLRLPHWRPEGNGWPSCP